MATKTFKIGLSNTDKQNMAQDVYERVLDLTFAEYDSTKTYNTGDFVVYNDALYKCKEDSVTGTWDSSKWESATLQDLLDDVESAVASVNGKANIIDLENGTLVVAKALTASQIENVSEEVGSTQSAPFVFQATGTDDNTTETPTAPVAKQLQLRGNSKAFNQLANITGTTETINGITFTNNGDGSWTISGTATANIYKPINTVTTIKTHKFLIKGANAKVGLYVYDKAVMNQDTIFTYNGNTVNNYLLFYVESGTDISTPVTVIPQLFNISLFGKYYDTVLAFNRDYPLPYYAFNAGTLKSCKSKKLITIGYNQFNEELQLGFINQTTGAVEINNSNVIPTDFIKVIAGQTYSLEAIDSTNRNRIIYEYDKNKNYIKYDYLYYPTVSITLSNDTHYVKFVYPNNDLTRKIAFHLTWDESRTGYEPYVKHEYDLPQVELRSAGNAYDEITPDGTKTTRIGVVDLGTQSWASASYGWYITLSDIKPVSSLYTKGNIICSKYPVGTSNDVNMGGVYGIALDQNKHIQLRDSSLSGMTGQQVAAALSGVYLYYELEEPTTSQVDSFPENIEVDDFGTMEFVPSDDNTDPIIPQGNQFFYPADYVLFIDDMYNRSKDGGEDADANNFVVKSELAFKELSADYIGEITSTQIVSGAFYKNEIAISAGLTNAKYVAALMSNGNLYPMAKTSSSIVCFNGINFQTGSVTVSKIYYKE